MTINIKCIVDVQLGTRATSKCSSGIWYTEKKKNSPTTTSVCTARTSPCFDSATGRPQSSLMGKGGKLRPAWLSLAASNQLRLLSTFTSSNDNSSIYITCNFTALFISEHGFESRIWQIVGPYKWPLIPGKKFQLFGFLISLVFKMSETFVYVHFIRIFWWSTRGKAAL